MKWQDFEYAAWKELDSKFDHKTYDEQIKKAIEEAETLEVLASTELPKRPPWKPEAHYNEDGDIIAVHLNDEVAFYAKWLTPQISVLLSMETDEIIGVEIWGTKRLFKENGISLVKE